MAGPDWKRIYTQNQMQRGWSDRMLREAQQLVVENWNARLAAGGPTRPSPTMGLLRAAGYSFIQVQCRGCGTTAWIEIASITAHHDTELAALAPRMRCQPCNWQAPPPRLERVLKERPPIMSLTG
jgi:hypothetical protein